MEILEIITLSKKNITDFAKERNLLLSKAKKEWVFFIDSDEVINNLEFTGKAGQASLTINNKFSGYKIRRDNYFLGQYVGSEKIIRLAKKSAGKWERRVHEIWKINGKVGYINNPVIIHNTAGNLNQYIKKINYYSDLHAQANKEEKKKSNLFKIIFYPIAKFIVTLIKSKNMVFSIMQAFHSYLSWSKLYFLHS
ncbi:MAG: hypothetical protein AAB535_03955 [Patescibacteria group bacterium]